MLLCVYVWVCVFQCRWPWRLEVFDLLELEFWAYVPVWPLAGTELGSSARAVILQAEPSSGAETCFVVVVVCFYATVPWYIPQRTQAAAPGASRYRMPEEGLDCGWHRVKSYEKEPNICEILFLLRLLFHAHKDVVCGWLVVSTLWSHSCLASSVPRKLRPSSGVHIPKDEEWVHSLLRWRMDAGKSFWFILFWVTMTLECKTFMEFYRRPSFALCWSAIQVDVNGTLHPWSLLSWTGGFIRPLCTGSWGSWVSTAPSGTVAIRHRASAPLDLQCQWAVYSWYMSPYWGHHWGKSTEHGFFDHKEGHFSLKMASRLFFFKSSKHVF